VSATVSVGHGTVDIGSGGGAAVISGNDSASVTITGSLAAINAALSTLKYQTSLTASGSDAIAINVTDAGKTGTGAVGITVIGNDTPALAVASAQTIHDTANHAISGVSVTDTYGGATVTATLSANAGNLLVTSGGSTTVTGNGSGSVTITGSLSAVNTALGTLQYATTATATGTDTITLSVNDNGTSLVGGAKTATATIAVNLVGNAAPAITMPAAQTISDTSQHAISGVALSDTYSGASITATVSAASGNLNLTASGSASIANNNSGTVTITGSQTDVNATLGSLKYTTTATTTAADTITVSINDNGASANLIGGSKTGVASIGVTLVGNDTPVVTVPALTTITDTNAHSINGVSVSDSAFSGTVTATVSAQHGNLAFTGSGITNNGTGTVTITAASPTALNTILGTLSYTTTATATSAETITVSVNDGNTSAIGGAKTGSNSFAINLIGNDAPVITVPATQGSIADTTPHGLSGISVADTYTGGTVTATLTTQGGTLTDTDPGVTGSGTGTLTITGSLSAVNAALADVSYTAASDGNGGAAADVVSVSVNDGNTSGIGNARSATSTIAITLINNDTPSITVPGLLTISDSSAHLVSGISASDSLSGTSLVATISDVSGTLSVTPAADYTVTTTNSSTNLTVTATSLANLNEALANLRYMATATTTSADTITVSLNDTGSSTNLIGGDLTGTKTIDVNVIGNDTPVLTMAAKQTVTTSAANSVTGLSVADTYSGSTITATVSAQHGSLDFTGGGVTGNDSGTVTVSAASVSALNTVLGTMKYTTSLTASGSDRIAVTVNDNGTGLVGGAKTATGNIEVAVIGNDSPVVSVSGEQSFIDTNQHALSGVGVTDSAHAVSVTATLSAQHGNLTVTGAGGASVGNNGTGTVTVTGSLADVNSTLGTLQYATTATATGSDVITVSVNDNATTLVGGAKTTSNTINIALIGNDTPALTVAGLQVYDDINQHSISGVGVADSYSGTTVTAAVSDTTGTLHCTAAGGLIITGNDSTSVSLSGSLSAVNTALGTLAYSATAAGSDPITITVNDGGTSRIGGAKSTTGIIQVTVFGNDTPVLSVPGTQTINDTAQHAIATSAVDIHSAASVTATVTAQHGILDATGGGANVANNDTATLTITGALADVNAALETLKYTSTRTSPGSDNISVMLNDNGTSLLGGAKSATSHIYVVAAPAITGPTSGGTVGTFTPAVSGTGEPGTTVKLYDGGTLVGTATVDGGGHWSVNTSTLTDGNHTLTATDTSTDGATSTPTTGTTVTVQGGPLPVPTGPGTVGSTTIPLQGGGGIPGSTVTIRDGGVVVGTTTVDGNGHWTYTAPGPEGRHSFTAQETDPFGNVGPQSAALTLTVSLPKPPPPLPPPPPPAVVEAPPPAAASVEAPANVTSIRAAVADTAGFTQGSQGGNAGVPAGTPVTSGGGFQVTLSPPSVNAVRDGSLFVAKGIPTVDVTNSNVISFAVPSDAFGHTNADAGVQLAAKLTDGRPLPPWVSFDPTKGTFVGEAPADFKGTLSVTVVARDSAGHEVATTFRIQVGGGAVKEGKPAAKPAVPGEVPAKAIPAGRTGDSGQTHDGKATKLGHAPTGKLAFTQQLKQAGRNAAYIRNGALAALVARS